MSAVWTVTVGNVGTMYEGPDEFFARVDYNDFVHLSQTGHGRVAGEDVTLFKDGVVVLEHSGNVSDDHGIETGIVASAAGNPCDVCGGRHAAVILSAGRQRCVAHHEDDEPLVVDEELDLTESLSFTRRQQDILLAALNQIASMGLFPADEVEDLNEQILNA